MKPEYFCGIDVSIPIYRDSIAIKNGNFIAYKTFNMTREGFNAFESILSQFKNNILIGMEATGIYHTNLLNFLKNKNYNTVTVNPYKLHQFFNFTNDKPTKTDKKDAKTICDFIEIHKLKDETNMLQKEKYSIKYFVREKERLTSRQNVGTKTKTEIRNLLCLVFSEIERNISSFNKKILTLLLRFPSANSIRNVSKEIFIKIVGKEMEKIYELAVDSIAGNYSVYESR